MQLGGAFFAAANSNGSLRTLSLFYFSFFPRGASGPTVRQTPAALIWGPSNSNPPPLFPLFFSFLSAPHINLASRRQGGGGAYTTAKRGKGGPFRLESTAAVHHTRKGMERLPGRSGLSQNVLPWSILSAKPQFANTLLLHSRSDATHHVCTGTYKPTRRAFPPTTELCSYAFCAHTFKKGGGVGGGIDLPSKMGPVTHCKSR